MTRFSYMLSVIVSLILTWHKFISCGYLSIQNIQKSKELNYFSKNSEKKIENQLCDMVRKSELWSRHSKVKT